MVHYAMAAVLVVAFAAGLISTIRPAVPNNGVFGAIARLEYQPYLADVLTIFVFLFAATPALLWLERRFGPSSLWATSICLYLAANLIQSLPALRIGIVLEPNRHGAFDFGSWQLVYVIGISIGRRLRSIHNAIKSHCLPLFFTGLALFSGAAAFRLVADLGGSGVGGQLRAALFGRHPLGPGRLAYIMLQLALIGMLTVKFWPSIEHSRITRAISLFGRSSLPIFVASVFTDYVLRTVIVRLGVAFPANIGCWLLELAMLLALAALFARTEKTATGDMQMKTTPYSA